MKSAVLVSLYSVVLSAPLPQTYLGQGSALITPQSVNPTLPTGISGFVGQQPPPLAPPGAIVAQASTLLGVPIQPNQPLQSQSIPPPGIVTNLAPTINSNAVSAPIANGPQGGGLNNVVTFITDPVGSSLQSGVQPISLGP
ncbi:hypothetical protein HDV03_004484 [Kappamyces sp. JEL0829]|nr:hypothetical protein HDV03_004484 [Kappamyces sp. JEL0829]